MDADKTITKMGILAPIAAAIAVAFLTLAGCASNPPPIIDLVGKDPVQANRDLAECHNHPYDHVPFVDSWPPTGMPESRCLESMGYKVLSRTQ